MRLDGQGMQPLPYHHPHQTYQTSHQQQGPPSYQTNGSIIVNPLSSHHLNTTTAPPSSVQTAITLSNTSCLDGRSNGAVIVPTGTDLVMVPDSSLDKKTTRDYIIIFLIFLGVIVMIVTAIASCIYLIKYHEKMDLVRKPSSSSIRDRTASGSSSSHSEKSSLKTSLYSHHNNSNNKKQDPCVNVKCNFGAECRDGRCICPSDCPTDLIQPVCLLVPTTSLSPSSDPSLRRLPHKPFATECEMRASVCKNELDIDADSFIYGDCPQDTHESKGEDAGNHHNDVTASSMSPQDTHHSNQGEDKRNDDGSSLPASSSISPLASSSKKDGVKFPSFSGNNDDEEDEDTVEGGVRGEDGTEEGSGDDGYSTGHEDDDEDEEEDNDEDERKRKVFVENKKKSEEDDGLYKSLEIELCQHIQCPIGSFCRIRKRRQHQSAPYSSTHTSLHQNANHEAFCDCHQMCSRINDLDLETPGWIREEVCGSNGLLYRNECQLRQESCQRDQVISLTTKSNCNGTFAQSLDHTSSQREVKKTHTSSLTPAVTSLHWGLPSSSSSKKNNKTKDHNEGYQESGGVGRKAKEKWKQKNDNNQENQSRDITNHNHHHQGNDHKKRNQSHFYEEGSSSQDKCRCNKYGSFNPDCEDPSSPKAVVAGSLVVVSDDDSFYPSVTSGWTFEAPALFSSSSTGATFLSSSSQANAQGNQDVYQNNIESMNQKHHRRIPAKCLCRPGVGGVFCDRCEADFWGLQKIVVTDRISGCLACNCHPLGSVRTDCEQMNGRCVCKPGVLGLKCDECPAGWKLTIQGCTRD